MFNCAFYRIVGLVRSIPVVFGLLSGKFFSAFAGGGAGLVQFPVLIFLGLSFAVALGLGAHAAITKGSRWIKKTYEVITIVIGIKLLF
jgi:uncharacterized membrane protein YfcA